MAEFKTAAALAGAALLPLLLWLTPAQADQQIETIARCVAPGDPELRVRACTALVEEDLATGRESDVPYANRAVAYAQLGQYRRAIDDYNQAIRFNPDDSLIHRRRGGVYARLGEYQLALQDFDRAIELGSWDIVSLHMQRGTLRAAVGEIDAAMADYMYAIDISGPVAVTTLQHMLAERGYDAGPVDGEYRAAVRTALEACLRDGCFLVE